ncbi:MAG: two-component regulator propeller domain-containing protein [Bacteroidota bacterium]
MQTNLLLHTHRKGINHRLCCIYNWISFLSVFLFAILFTCKSLKAVEWNKSSVECIGVEQGLSQNTVNCIYKDNEGFIWISTGDGLNRYNGRDIRVYRNTRKEKETLSNLIRGRVAEDSQGNIWYGTESGFYFVNRYDSHPVEGFSFKKHGVAFMDFHLRFILRDTIWFTNYHKGIGYFSIAQKTFGFFSWPEKGDSPIPFNLRISHQGSSIYYIGADGKKIYAFNCNKKKYFIAKALNGSVSFFTANENGHYYFCKDNKIYTYSDKNPQPVCLTTGRELPPACQITGIILDKKNHLWIGTQKQGLYVVDLKKGAGNC